MPIPLAAIPMILGGAQAIAGLAGRAINKRPKYNIPSSILRATKLAQMRTQDNMPGYSLASGNINLTAANALAAARETGRAGEQLQSIIGQSNRAYRELAGQNAQYRNQADLQYEQSLGRLAQFQDQAFQMNEFAPYADRQQLYEDMFGAGMQNLFSGATMITQGAGMPSRDGRLTAPLTELPRADFSSVSSTSPAMPVRPPNRLTRPLAPLTEAPQAITPPGRDYRLSTGLTPIGSAAFGPLMAPSQSINPPGRMDLRPVFDALKLSFLGF